MVEWLERRWLVLAGAGLALVLAAVLAAPLIDGEPGGIVFQYGGAEDGSPIRVQVSGAVVSPGVYELRQGDRVLEALAAAGGLAPDADVDELNLARRVRDEEKITVPRKGTAVGEKLDINAATERQLQGLPGIGEAYSRRIVDSRRVDGPYRDTRELVERRVIPASTYEQIRDMITVSP